MFETKEGLEKGMREATKNLEGSRGLGSNGTSWTLLSPQPCPSS